MNDTGTKRNLSELCADLTDCLNATQLGKSERCQLNELYQALGKALDIAEAHRRTAEAHRRRAMMRLMRWLGIGTGVLGIVLVAIFVIIIISTWGHEWLGAVLLSALAPCIAGMLFAALRVLHQVIDQQ